MHLAGLYGYERSLKLTHPDIVSLRFLLKFLCLELENLIVGCDDAWL